MSRETGITLITTLPHISMVDSIGFNLTNYVIYMIAPANMNQPWREGIVFRPVISIDKRTQRTLEPIRISGAPMRIQFIKNEIPEGLVTAYEKRKREYVMGKLREGLGEEDV